VVVRSGGRERPSDRPNLRDPKDIRIVLSSPDTAASRTPDTATSVTDAHRRSGTDVATELGVTIDRGLDAGEVTARRDRFGANELAAAARVPAWRRLLAQFTDLLILILIAAAVVAFAVSGELKTPLVVLVVVLFNAIIGFVQESRAEKSLDALRKMLVVQTRVRRGGELHSVPAGDLVPGDVVMVEAGDRVPADGRLLLATNLEIEEAALTGESQPAVKHDAPVDRDAVPLGDRKCMVYMNTTVTRGRGEFVVTATGMTTEIGRIAGLLRETETEKTPLQKQLDGLAHSLAKLAAAVVIAVFVIGLIRGESASDLLLTAVALAVASIPEGLPAVTAVTLALGVAAMARQNAIVKRLASVETLGCTSVICSDKTGTLTLNQMTAVDLVLQLRSHDVTGDGYSPVGTIEHHDDDESVSLDAAAIAMALCNDAVVRADDDGRWQLVGDPTEGALVVLSSKAGVDVEAVRRRHPRLAELPFDSANKFMATVHELPDDLGASRVTLFVKGAPDVLLRRSTTVIGADGRQSPIEAHEAELSAHNDRLGAKGLRVLALARRDLRPDDWSDFVASGGDPIDLVSDLTLLALVGIVDPPRPEARLAIAEARDAGITVKMITGDHAVTAAAIGKQLGLDGRAVTGADLDRMDDAQLADEIDEIAVFARVAPEHKIRLVAALQRNGNVVAMTGDGVNDAPALKKADMGVAMGITGTEVTKEAATMVLTDDNFATIVRAVRQGRTIYDNIVKFVRFQLSTTLGFAILFLLAAIFGIADGKPFTAIAILWVNIIMDGPPAMALALDREGDDVMKRTPRPLTEKILTPPRWVAVSIASAVMAIGTLAVLHFAPGPDAGAGVATVAGTMAFNTFVLFQFFNILNARSDRQTVFSSFTLTNRWLWVALAAVVLLQVGVTHVGFMQSLFDTTSISLGQWLVCIVVASSILLIEEVRKVFVRRAHPLSSHPAA
jgi:P-type Ca2+ transporter type 2C